MKREMNEMNVIENALIELMINTVDQDTQRKY